MSDSGRRLNELSKRAREQINKGGHAFHESVVRRLVELTQGVEESPFRVTAVELPVSANTTGGVQDTAIDILLSSRSRTLNLVVEVKRSIDTWAFVSTDDQSLRRRNYLRADVLWAFPNGPRHPRPGFVGMATEQTDLAFALSESSTPADSESGESRGGRDRTRAIGEAFAQVSRGVTGYIEALMTAAMRGQPNPPQRVAVLPVIITNAPLLIAAEEVSSADLEQGKITGDILPASPANFVLHRYRRPLLIRHAATVVPTALEPQDMLAHLSIRTVMVVNSIHIEQWLRWVENNIEVQIGDRGELLQ